MKSVLMLAAMSGLLGGCVSMGSQTYRDPQQTGSTVKPVCQSGAGRGQTLFCAAIIAQQAVVKAIRDD